MPAKLKKNLGISLTLSVLIFLSAGCATRIGDFSVLSTGAPQYANMETAPMTQTVKASDGRLWFLFIPLDSEPNLKEAVDRCLDKGHGDFMERARFYKTAWSFILFGHDGYKVIGDVGNSKEGQLKQKR